MKTFARTKPLAKVLRELPVEESIIIPNSQARSASVRYLVYKLRKEGYDFICTQKGLLNKVKVIKLK